MPTPTRGRSRRQRLGFWGVPAREKLERLGFCTEVRGNNKNVIVNNLEQYCYYYNKVSVYIVDVLLYRSSKLFYIDVIALQNHHSNEKVPVHFFFF